MQKIIPFLWFDNQAEEAANYYVSIFKNSKINHVSRYGDAGPGPKGTAMVVTFTLEGQDFTALNGGPLFHFTEAISLYVNCETQEEVDTLWNKLIAGGGNESQCGWLKDKYGLSWQIIPTTLQRLLSDKDPVKAGRAMKAMLKMQKINIQALQDAFDGK
ncbi:VOC family protein [Puia dinghuensis]|uniref:VOC family protein n=1 Tax=Puia dinghuensis TaxID=1792502 RepID=A0A8J2U676_9BACT|nr:VOC family protein [Puia dinghuensis]GGA81494.1 VOC family protein [Puia dinghuensis]